jgi:predicted DNA-binding protein with PD1-like motif
MQVSGMGQKSAMEGGSSASPHGMMPSATRMDLSISGAPAQGNELPVKRKRGRPRKFATVDSMAAPAANSGTTESLFSALAKKIAAPYPPPGSADKSEKRGRGRPIGSTKKQQLANLGVVLVGAGKSFTPHILTVNTGEDALSKIMQFAQHGPRAMCVLSANGAVSNVILRQESSSVGTVTYEGRYEILSLSGSYVPTDGENGAKQRTGGLSVSLAGSDGRVFGGGVAGLLTAASPIQVVVGSFLLSTSKDAKVDSPLRLTQGVTSDMMTPPVAQQHRQHLQQQHPQHPQQQHPGSSKDDFRGTSGAGPREGPQAPSTSGPQPLQQRPQAVGVFQPSEGWGIAPHVPFLGDNRRADINIPLAGG